jgi:hypothetical protein
MHITGYRMRQRMYPTPNGEVELEEGCNVDAKVFVSQFDFLVLVLIEETAHGR